METPLEALKPNSILLRAAQRQTETGANLETPTARLPLTQTLPSGSGRQHPHVHANSPNQPQRTGVN